jgi:hypothetical protein
MKPFVFALILGCTMAAPAVPGAVANDNVPRDPGAVQLAEDVDIGDIVFSEIERRLIRSYYDRNYALYIQSGGKNKHKNIPPGIAKKGWLPPGIYKQLVAGQRIPGDVALYPLPYDLRGQLPYRSGYDYYIVDDKVLLVQVATNLILDVLTVAAIEALD